MSKLTIVMYHYVRDLKHSQYPEIKGLSVDLFKEQLQYFLRYYKIIKMEELIEAVKLNKELPDNSLLLTFDDGYKDHFEFVFPILDELGIQGSFFPPAKAIQEHHVLDVNKIHFILASVKEKKQIIFDIYSMLDKFRKEYSLENNEYYFRKLAKENRFDTKEVIFIKRILQRELPEKLRNIIINSLFNKYVSKDEGSFSRELYMNIDQLKCMKRKGMYIGSHGYDHYWLNTLSKEKQKREIELSLDFLKKLGCDINDWVMCYPYGAYNESLLFLLKENGCKLALTTQVGIADLNKDHPLILPRLDTNDLPKDRFAKPNIWTLKVINF
ncbi:polysaccharide deacetylase [Anoxybacter fermentans]|uniref:Polysaccharide deacetylase n=1 Tax=Anoxybacter fermentans TaxID=1323375 RepID=A0A3S9T177_9FIRM|nr:polysaccharide deacetylase family protein [Anoxybacter fermentans]AZR74366.1 polysaccharide deacetylase [Anoxybacter fermentans]